MTYPTTVRPELVSTTKAAVMLDCAPGTVRKLMADGKLTEYRVGRLVKCDVREIERLLSRATVRISQ
jgi:excisionase family DNA binding protein